MARSDLPRLHLVTDDAVLADPDFRGRAGEALAAGGADVALHLRGPGTPSRRLHELATALREAAREAESLLLMNDRVDVALAAGLDGVQLPGRGLPVEAARALLGPEARVGASVHDPDAAAAAAGAGADFLVVGTVFATSSHPERAPAGPELLDAVGAATDLPLLAIGGVTPERVGEVIAAGAHGVAVLSGVWGRDAAPAVRSYVAALDARREEGG